MGSEIFAALGKSLALTLAFEIPFCLLFRIRGRHDILLTVLVNILTNPAVVLTYILLMSYTRYPEWAVVLPLELLAVAVEGLCYKYRGENIPRPFLLSLGANAFSYGVGLIIRFF